jgi:hypothetical protein
MTSSTYSEAPAMHKRLLYLVPQQYEQAFFGQVRASRSAGDAAAAEHTRHTCSR